MRSRLGSQILTGGGLVAGVLLAAPGAAMAGWTVGGEIAPITAQAAELPAGATPTARASERGSSVSVSWPERILVDGVAVDGYRLARVNASTGETADPAGTCDGVVASTSCVDSNVPDGRWTYQVHTVMGLYWTGPWSAASDVVRVETVPTTASVSFPAAREYTTAQFDQGCSGFCGTVGTAVGTSLSEMRVTLMRAGQNYWDGSEFKSKKAVLLPVSVDGGKWRVNFSGDEFAQGKHGYVLQVVAVDSKGGTDTTTVEFTVHKVGKKSALPALEPVEAREPEVSPEPAEPSQGSPVSPVSPVSPAEPVEPEPVEPEPVKTAEPKDKPEAEEAAEPDETAEPAEPESAKTAEPEPEAA